MRAALPKVLFLLAALASIAFILIWRRPPDPTTPTTPASNPGAPRISDELAAEVAQLENRERAIAESLWAPELQAQDSGRTIENLWDSLKASSNKLPAAAAFPIGQVIPPAWLPAQSFPHQIKVYSPNLKPKPAPLTSNLWTRFILGQAAAGWRLLQCEFRHVQFTPPDLSQPGTSRYYFSAHLTHSNDLERAILEGHLQIQWTTNRSADGLLAIHQVDATDLTLKTRSGPPPFQPLLTEKINPPQNSFSIDPLIVYDLDDDGFSEIILAQKNILYRRSSSGLYQQETFCNPTPGLFSTALIADFDQDAIPDFLCMQVHGLTLFKGSARRTFDRPPDKAWNAPPDVKYPMVLTSGDIDQDGDLDLFLAQYKVPYENGAMPTPFHDANDGYPAYLLLNNGQGQFTDATAASGLEPKRRRRSYSASFADLNADGHLDLIVISDFAGVDVYQNDGHGKFQDMTAQWLSDPHGFGMGHALADFNSDGRLDLLMIGMTSPTADRLNHLNLWRPSPDDPSMRSSMTYGNRLFLARPTPGFEQTPLSHSIARSGWSWGCSAADFDNDSFQDVYIANGLESRPSVRDYEAEYWLHDMFVGNSEENPAAYIYFKNTFGRTRDRGQSYGGYEKNRLYLNEHGSNFVEVAHLMGLALENDSRNVVSDDLDGDGRIDLIATSFEGWPSSTQILHIYKNNLPNPGNWIAFQFPHTRKSPIGAQITIRYQDRTATRQIVNGDSYRSQHSQRLHFGLGSAPQADSAHIRWPDGSVLTLHNLQPNKIHTIQPPN